MIKLLMTSTAYRQASLSLDASATNGPPAVDPGNRLLWRMRMRRLEAEAIRDSMLAVSGALDTSMEGPPVPIAARPDGLVIVAENSLTTPSSQWRRSVYLLYRRSFNLSFLTVFDQPLLATTCPRRDVSAVPLQSLTMLNDAFVAEQSDRFARRVLKTAGTHPEQQVRHAYLQAFSREPDSQELGWCLEFLEQQATVYRGGGFSAADIERRALGQLCLTLFNCSEFLYRE